MATVIAVSTVNPRRLLPEAESFLFAINSAMAWVRADRAWRSARNTDNQSTGDCGGIIMLAGFRRITGALSCDLPSSEKSERKMLVQIQS
jgi:hypothetical protein